MLKVTAKEIMSEEVVTISDTATVAQAAHILLRFRINGILIVKGKDRNAITGVITTSDLLNFIDEAISKGRRRVKEILRISRMPLKNFTSKKVICIDEDTKIEKIIAIMHREKKHTLPVTRGKKLVGVIGKHDVLNAAYGS